MVFQDLGFVPEEHEECHGAAVRTILSADFWTSERPTKWNEYTIIRTHVKAAHEHKLGSNGYQTDAAQQHYTVLAANSWQQTVSTRETRPAGIGHVSSRVVSPASRSRKFSSPYTMIGVASACSLLYGSGPFGVGLK